MNPPTKPKTFSDHLKEVKGKVIYFDGKDYWRKQLNLVKKEE